MSSIIEYYEAFHQLDLTQAVVDVFNATAEEIANRQATQMSLGFKSTGEPITPQYADLTIEIKKQKDQETRWVTLRDTGSFQSLIKIQADRQALHFDSSDSKRDKLIEKYGENIFGLNLDTQDEYNNETFQPRLANYVEEKIGIKI